MNNTAAYWVNILQLLPHPEGGFYKEVFRSAQQVLRVNETAVKQACTSIYYLLEAPDYSTFHRLMSDECWYFHKGAALNIHIINPQGKYTIATLSDEATGALSVVVPAGYWFAATVQPATGFTLVSCAVAPGFDFAEFEIATRQSLTQTYPQHTQIIERFCKK